MSPQIILLTLNGLTNAALLFVLGSGLTLAFGLMRVVNLAHGAFYLLGGYVGWSLFRGTHNWFLAFAGGGISIALLGWAVERFMLGRVRGSPLSESLLTIALSIIIADLALAIWGGHALTISVPRALNPRVELFGVTYPGFRYLVLLLSILIGLGLWLLLYRTRMGAAVRAGVDDREMVDALGVNIRRIFALVFVLASLLAGIAGVIGGSFLGLAPGGDTQILILSLVVVILGGMGSLGGAAVGALLTGLILSFGRAYFPEISYFLLFAPMALVLALRPHGLFGRPS